EAGRQVNHPARASEAASRLPGPEPTAPCSATGLGFWRRASESPNDSSCQGIGEAQQRRCERQPGKSKADLKGDSSRELDSAIQMPRPSAELCQVFGNGTTKQD